MDMPVVNGWDSHCPVCKRKKGERHADGCIEGMAQMLSKSRPKNFGRMTIEQKYLVDQKLGILHWCGN